VAAVSACLGRCAVVVSREVASRVRPLPERQEDFFDLLPLELPGSNPEAVDLDPVAARLPSTCSAVRDLVALGVAASQLHSFTLTPSGYDLSLPDFDGVLGGDERAALQRSCRELSWTYAWVMGLALEMSTLCPRACHTTALGSLPERLKAGCQAALSPGRAAAGATDGLSSAMAVPMDDLSTTAVAGRAVARTRSEIGGWCSRWAARRPSSHLAAPHHEALTVGAALAGEVRIFLDHAFHTLGLGPAGLPTLAPFSTLLADHTPIFVHVPVAGQRWDALRVLLEGLAQRVGSGATPRTGLRVAEVGVEKGMTAAALLRSVPAVQEYVLVDTWHLPGKPAEFNNVLEGYYRNLEAWAASEPTFQRGNASAARLMRMPSQKAAGHFGDGYFDLVFIDAEHTFPDVQRDMAVWKRRVRPDGGVLAGHDFSLFHPAVSLAVLVECGPGSSDALRFPLEGRGGRPLLHLSADTVWWCVRAGDPEPRG